MTILQAWGESLTLLQPKNLKLFALVTLKSIVETYKLLLKYWWWLFTLMFALAFGIVYIGSWTSLVSYTWHMQVFGFLLFFRVLLDWLSFFAICLATRPSTTQKNCAYFRSYMPHCIYIIVFLGLLLFLAFVGIKQVLLSHISFSVSPIMLYFVQSLGQSFMIFLTLFFFDSALSVKNMWYAFCNALKMIMYNAPLCCMAILLITCFFYACDQLILYLFSTGDIYNFFFRGLLAPIIVCTFANIYIKKLHDHYELYFPQPK